MTSGVCFMQGLIRKMASMTGLVLLVLLLLSPMGSADEKAAETQASELSQQSGETHVIQAFTSQQDIESKIIKIDDQRKRQIMFAMGVPLLLLIFITAGLGIAMGIFGKDVYIAHMIFAGLSLTLALGHAIVGVVWFWPF